MAQHRSSFKRGSGTTSRNIIKYGDAVIVLIEKFPCDNKDDIRKRERFWVETLDCVNKNIPGRGKKEYQKGYRNDHKAQITQYREDHKDQQEEYQKQYHIQNKAQIHKRKNTKVGCDCGGRYTYANKAQHFDSDKHFLWEFKQIFSNDNA
tara:strand:+ start:3255 stop:3704 length:450 start_codon:yes stop_codon:yes gene_type:complete